MAQQIIDTTTPQPGFPHAFEWPSQPTGDPVEERVDATIAAQIGALVR